jgi:hypothetical protein
MRVPSVDLPVAEREAPPQFKVIAITTTRTNLSGKYASARRPGEQTRDSPWVERPPAGATVMRVGAGISPWR